MQGGGKEDEYFAAQELERMEQGQPGEGRPRRGQGQGGGGQQTQTTNFHRT